MCFQVYVVPCGLKCAVLHVVSDDNVILDVIETVPYRRKKLNLYIVANIVAIIFLQPM